MTRIEFVPSRDGTSAAFPAPVAARADRERVFAFRIPKNSVDSENRGWYGSRRSMNRARKGPHSKETE